MQPREPDQRETGRGISIWASRQLHRVASGGWWMSRKRQDAICTSTSYSHQRFPGNCHLEFERCRNFKHHFCRRAHRPRAVTSHGWGATTCCMACAVAIHPVAALKRAPRSPWVAVSWSTTRWPSMTMSEHTSGSVHALTSWRDHGRWGGSDPLDP